jgi:predicted O-linked N-acetylglucosamine transferase (SPINDLY family)
VSASLLTAIGRPQWIADTPEDYVRIAVNLAWDASVLMRERETLRTAMEGSALLDHSTQAARFGSALRSMWEQTCTPSAAALDAQNATSLPAGNFCR